MKCCGRPPYPTTRENVLLVLLLVIVVMLLASCGRTPHPEPVKIAVPVPCIAKQLKRPNYPTVQTDDGLFERVQKLLAERELRMAYEGELEAQASACG